MSMTWSINCKLLLYADDSALIVSVRCIKEISCTLSHELSNIHDRLIGLSLHLGKTDAILFGSKRKVKTSPLLSVKCYDKDISNKTVVSYMGADLDNLLSGENMATKVIKKVEKNN